MGGGRADWKIGQHSVPSLGSPARRGINIRGPVPAEFIRTTTHHGPAPARYSSGQQQRHGPAPAIFIRTTTHREPPPAGPSGQHKRREDFWPPFLRCFWLARTSGYRRRPVQQLLAAAQRALENLNEPEGETGFTDGPEALSHPLPRAPWVCSRALVGLVGVGGLRVGII